MTTRNLNVLANLSRWSWKLFAVAAPVAGLLLALTSPVAAQKSPETIRLTPQSKEGAVLLRVDRIPADYQLWLQKSGTSGFGSRVYAIKVEPGAAYEVYVARTLKPGRYHLTSIWQQKRWGLLFPVETFEFDVQAGKIIYLGKLDTLTLLKTLQDKVVTAGRTVSMGPGSGFSTDKHGLRPRFEARDDTSVAKARVFASRTMQARDDTIILGELHATAAE
jgi:hypothetical protein